MSTYVYLHNTRCSKSRTGLQYLKDAGVEDIEVIEYLKTPLTVDQLRDIGSQLDTPISSLVRTGDDLYKTLKFNVDDAETVYQNIAENPQCMERPILVNKVTKKATIGRPTEKFDLLL